MIKGLKRLKSVIFELGVNNFSARVESERMESKCIKVKGFEHSDKGSIS